MMKRALLGDKGFGGLRHPLRFCAVILLGKPAVSMKGIDFALLRKRRTARLSLGGMLQHESDIIERNLWSILFREYNIFE